MDIQIIDLPGPHRLPCYSAAKLPALLRFADDPRKRLGARGLTEELVEKGRLDSGFVNDSGRRLHWKLLEVSVILHLMLSVKS